MSARTASILPVGGLVAVGAALACLLAPAPARADTDNFELNGKIYTKYLYKNDDSAGCLSLSNPFWPDNIGGNNGACTEFELTILGRASKYVTTGVRLKSRFGALWQGWWENGDVRWDYPNDTLFVENTSGESLGMNHAQYVKLRGAFIRVAPPIPTVRWVHIGASDLGMFNEWTVGKVRYIDRDNANGVFVEGDFADRTVQYHAAAIATPKLFIGPRWTSGLSNADPRADYWASDWTYALKLDYRPSSALALRLIGSYVHDWEADDNDPDATGPSDVERGTNRAIEREIRYQGANATLDARLSPESMDWLNLTGLVAYSYNLVNTDYAANSVRDDQGFSPLLYLVDGEGEPEAAQGFAGKVRVEMYDPFEAGVSLKLEYFNIGSEFNAIFGARREGDVLLTDGIIGSGFIKGGQLPTLNLANEFIDFDEAWYETIIGWHGATALLELQRGLLAASLEGTFVTYNTNQQGRDTDNQYPDFLYTDGFTDPQAFTADQDYGNIYDRGSDPRSVYKEFQDRQTLIAVLNAESAIPGAEDLKFAVKGKWVHDTDSRKADNAEDDYVGDLFLGYGMLKWQATNEFATGLGYEWQRWDEERRSGSQEQGFYDYATTKHTGRLVASYTFGGLTFNYLLEYFHKDQERDRPGSPDQQWRVWRAKASVETGW